MLIKAKVILHDEQLDKYEFGSIRFNPDGIQSISTFYPDETHNIEILEDYICVTLIYYNHAIIKCCVKEENIEKFLTGIENYLEKEKNLLTRNYN
jgi:hypothetical protein